MSEKTPNREELIQQIGALRDDIATKDLEIGQYMTQLGEARTQIDQLDKQAKAASTLRDQALAMSRSIQTENAALAETVRQQAIALAQQSLRLPIVNNTPTQA